MIDVSTEIKFQTARSGGKGGQNVNKVETMVEGYYHVAGSRLLTDEQKTVVSEKLASRINSEGFLLVKSQQHRTQLQNKQQVVKKTNELIAAALLKQKKRVPSKPGKAAREKRIQSKKRNAEVKEGRKRVGRDGY